MYLCIFAAEKMAELKETMTEKMAELKAEKTILKDNIRDMRQARLQMQTNGKKQLEVHKLNMHLKMRKMHDIKDEKKKVLMMKYKELHDTWQEDIREFYNSCNKMKRQFRKEEGMLRAEIQKLDAHRDRARQLLKAVEEKQKRLKLEQEKAKPTRKYGSARK